MNFINNADILILIAYFTLVFWIAYIVTARTKKEKDGEYNSSDYFLGGRNQGWLVIGASLFASNIGSEHLVGLAGAGARGDMPAAQFELLAALILLILGWFFVPLYLKSGVFTMPEFLEKRYSRSARNYLSVVSILAYILTKISITIFAGALVFEVLGVEFWTGALLVVIATGAYTIMGGLKAVLYTDMMQMFVLLIGAIGVTVVGLEALGGPAVLFDVLSTGVETGSSIPHLDLWRSLSDPEFPWTGILLGAPILGVWYWCTDQFIVQRVLSARDTSTARKGTIFAGFLKILPLFLFVMPGIIAYALQVQGKLPGMSDPDQALPALITQLLPHGLKGLVLAGLLAALMSSLSSVFNSCSTLFTIDIYKRIEVNASERELVFVGQLATLILVIISLIWIPFMRSIMEGGGLYKYLQSIQAYISPPIASVFLFGLFFRRLNGIGAISALWVGFALGMSRLVMEFLQVEGTISLAPGTLLSTFVNANFLHFALFLFIVCTLILFAVSHMYRSPVLPGVDELIFKKKLFSGERRVGTDLALSVGLVGLILVIWFVFSSYGIALKM